MNRAFVISLLAALAAGSRAEQPPTRQELLEKIDALQARVEQLERERHGPGDAGARPTARDVDQTVSAVRRDADARAANVGLGERFLGAWQDGFRIRSDDGRFLLHPWLQLQFRGVVNARERGGDDGESSDTQSGFELRRCYLAADGTAGSPDLSYLFIWAVNRHNGALDSLATWVAYHFPGTRFTVKAGQFSNPLDHESLTLSRYQLAADRSLTADVLAGGDDYVQGVQLEVARGDDLRAFFALTDGFDNNNKNFQDYPVGKANFGLAGRAEWKIFGNWTDYRDFTAVGDARALCVIGAAFDWTEAGGSDAFRHVVDAQYESPSGIGLYAAYLGRYTTGAPAVDGETYDASVRFQGSYALTPKQEVFARYEFLRLDPHGLPSGVHGDVHAVTIGWNYYAAGHRAKFTADVIYLPNGSPANDDGSGILATGDPEPTGTLHQGGGNELVARLQFQLYL